MADTKAAVATPAKGAKAAGGDKPKKKVGKPRNYDLGNGVYRFSRSRMYHKKALWKFVGKKNPKKEKAKNPTTIVKQIGGDKNGGTRVVLLKKRRSVYPTADRIKKRPAKKYFHEHKRYTRPSLTPGTVCILLAGPHKGKRVVLLGVLESGLLLVTGPFKLNACPLRRVSQNYVIATQTQLDMSAFKLPEHIKDDYFKRSKKRRAKKEEGDIFSPKKEAYKPSDQRKADQASVDKQLLEAIRKRPDKKHMYRYLSAMFGLRSSQYPHRMKF